MKKEDLAMKEKLSKLAILDTLLAKKEALTEAEEMVKDKLLAELSKRWELTTVYSYSQPSQSEDIFCNDMDMDSHNSETDDLIRRDQAELALLSRSPVQYPPQPEVEFGFPQVCYCGAKPQVATSPLGSNHPSKSCLSHPMM
ncbi:Myb-like domain-containing protein [Raphanus sativus]|nr:Myb-like domain-containing protein [Raphanus sativus]